MKTKLILMWNFNSVFGQICGTSHSTNPTIYPQEYNNTQVKSSSSSICINVFFHVIRNTNGTNAFPIPNTDTIISELNEFYSPHNITINNLGTDFINNSGYLEISEGEHTTLMNSGYDVTNAINYYIVEELWDVYTNGAYQGFVTGAADNISSNSLVIRSDRVFESTSPHELGHCLNLYHTHKGLAYNDPGCAENINGSNCNSCGDLVCDTPADSGQGNSGGYSPDLTNTMSYYNNRNNFTDGQSYRMKYAIQNETVLQNIVGSSCTTISEVNNVCFLQTKTVTLSNIGNATAIWTSSNNVQIVTSTNTTTQIRALNYYSYGNGWIRATLNNGIILQENFQVGSRLSLITSGDIGPYGQVDVSVSGGTTPYKYYRGTTLLKTSNSSSVTLAFGCNGGVLKVAAQSSCGQISKSTIIMQQCNNYYSFNIYPNPTSETLTIKKNEKKSYQNLASSRSRSVRNLENSSFELYDFNSNLVTKKHYGATKSRLMYRTIEKEDMY